MKIALIQLNARDNKKKNIDRALRLTLQAVRSKARFILLPELFNFRGSAKSKKGLASVAEPIPRESLIPFMILAKARRVFILAGSIYEKAKGTNKVYNTSVLIDDKGRIRAQYRKINLFKALVDGKKIDESKRFLAGCTLAMAMVGEFKAGLSICYDLRFPELFRRYAEKGADILCVPSSFTETTGRAHWEILLRARAVENLCYVLAPGQFGKTPNGVTTYGNSMVVDPWGKILTRASGNREGVLYADISKEEILKARQKLPHARK